MAPFLPTSLYATSLPLAAVAAGQREQQQAVAYSVAESSLKQRFTMAPAPAEQKKIAMYSKVLMQWWPSGARGVGHCVCQTPRRGPQPKGLAPRAVLTHRRRRRRPPAPPARPHPQPAAAHPARPLAPSPPQDFYVACSLGGIVACGATHTAVTPLDVVKCNMQTDPKNYTGIVQVRV